MQVKYAENGFTKHRFKALFLGLQCLPFAYGATKFQEVQSWGDLEAVWEIMFWYFYSVENHLTVSLDQLHSLSPQRLREYSFSCLGAFWFFAVFSDNRAPKKPLFLNNLTISYTDLSHHWLLQGPSSGKIFNSSPDNLWQK